MLARLLGEIPNFVAVGEAGSYFLGPEDFSKSAIPCGCGASMQECSLWGKLAVDPAMPALGRPFTRPRYMHRALWGMPETHKDLQRFLAAASEFYHALARTTGASVIVDSSKNPAFGALLTQASGIEVYAVHMIRDLRGVVTSGLRARVYIPATSVHNCILQWYWANAGAEFLQKRAVGYSRLRYEDLVAYPKPLLEPLASAIRRFPVSCSFLHGGQAHLHPQHHALGNPSKFQCGEILLRERKPELRSVMKKVVSLAGWPLLMRYGYLSQSRNGRAYPAVVSAAPGTGRTPAVERQGLTEGVKTRKPTSFETGSSS